MKLLSERHSDTLVIRVDEARIDAAAAVDFKDSMRRATQDGAARVVLDLSQVTMVDSSGLGAIVAVMKQLGAGCPLELAGLTPNVATVFRLTRMDTVMRIHGDVDDALSLARPAC
ncbi:MAG: STAS domain-containing protein [Pseudomonadota bacterium]